MARVLDLNTTERPTLELTLQDKDRTMVPVSTPTEALVQELNTLAPEMTKVLKTGDAASIAAMYDLAARLISCNRSGLQITAEDLREKYHMNLESALIFFSAYMDFITEITQEKN